MPAPLFRVSVLALCAAAFVPAGTAQEVRSRPVGFLTVTIPAGQTRSFSIPFDADVSSLPHAVGRLTAVGANYLENSAAAWTPGAFSSAASPYFVRLINGPHAGRILRISATANTATRLYVSDDGVGLASLGLVVGENGTAFEIFPGDTLATFFGTAGGGSTLVVQGGATPQQADLVHVWSGASWLNFYYNTAWNRWALDTDAAGDATRNHYLLRPDRGLMLSRRAAAPLTLSVVGRVLGTPQRAAHARTANALTFLATMQPRDISLGNLALQASSRTVAWRGGPDAASADLVLVWSGASWLRFYFNDVAGTWQLSDDPTNRNNYLVRAGTPVFIQRRTAGSTADDKTVAFPQPGT